ncbi:MAG: DUF192 domain-containing protein [Myxococcota bacterium]|nr:DUF192 domain-containing protein [Myxococcota bacterium]
MNRAGRAPALLASALLACGSGGLAGGDGDRPWVSIRGTQVSVELARTPAEQVQGLSDRRELAWGQGMLFQYPRASFQRFWMKRMHFAIDMVWIRDGQLVEISHRVPLPAPGTPDSRLPTYGARELIDSVLEVPAGFAQAHGWRRGDRVELSPATQR